MGYNTSYSLSTYNSDLDISEILEKIRESEFDALAYAINEYGETEEPCRWYDHEEDMVRLSLLYPDVILKLHGKGEENGDCWDKYFKNGKMQTCRAQFVFPPFDENQLK